MSVMVLQGRKSSPQKSRPLESGHSRHAVWIASYKLCQKKEFKFLCELGLFLQRQSQIIHGKEKGQFNDVSGNNSGTTYFKLSVLGADNQCLHVITIVTS